MLIFEKKKMKFAAYFNSDGAKARRSEYALNAFDTHDLDSIINAEEDKINALDSLGDLGDIDTDTEFADIQGESDEPQSEESIEKSIQGIGKTMSVVGNMKTALDDFYKSEEGDFVNLAVIFDACGLIDEHFPDVVHSELAIDSKIYSANAGEEMISIIKREIKL